MYSLTTFDIHIIESVISDTYTITASNTEFLQTIAKIRQNTNAANNKTRIFFTAVAFPLQRKKAIVREHNTSLRPICEELQQLCEKAMVLLDTILNS